MFITISAIVGILIGALVNYLLTKPKPVEHPIIIDNKAKAAKNVASAIMQAKSDEFIKDCLMHVEQQAKRGNTALTRYLSGLNLDVDIVTKGLKQYGFTYRYSQVSETLTIYWNE